VIENENGQLCANQWAEFSGDGRRTASNGKQNSESGEPINGLDHALERIVMGRDRSNPSRPMKLAARTHVAVAVKKANDKRARRGELRRMGICVICLVAPSTAGLASCAPCRVGARSRRRRTYLALRALGICVQCAEDPAERPHVLCKACREIMALKMRYARATG
jgi:hypothetical protein